MGNRAQSCTGSFLTWKGDMGGQESSVWRLPSHDRQFLCRTPEATLNYIQHVVTNGDWALEFLLKMLQFSTPDLQILYISTYNANSLNIPHQDYSLVYFVLEYSPYTHAKQYTGSTLKSSHQPLSLLEFYYLRLETATSLQLRIPRMTQASSPYIELFTIQGRKGTKSHS